MMKMTGKSVDKFDDYMTVAGYNVQLNLYMPGIIKKMSLSDFRKMLTVIQHEVEPADFRHCLKLWDNALALALTDGSVTLTRSHKMYSILYKKYEKLPAWLTEDADDRL